MVTKDYGFVLKRYNFRETSVITNLYTLKFGKITGILKGFYTLKREFSSPLDIFSLNEIIFYPKKRDIWLISFTDLIDNYTLLRKNYAKAKTAAVISEIIDKIMQPWDKNGAIFELFKNCLGALSQQEEKKVLYIFLIKFLSLCGFKPEFNRCIICHTGINEQFFFSVSKGGLLCQRCHRAADDYQKIKQESVASLLYIQTADFNLASRLKPTFDSEKEILCILKAFLFYHLDFDISFI
jgi:DNA repair protein RecO (recombination protein O)